MTRSRRPRLLAAVALALALASAATVLPARGQNVRAHVRVDSVSVGERFTLVVTSERPVWARSVFPSPPPDTTGEVLQVADVLLLKAILDSSTDPSESTLDSVLYEATTFALDTAIVGPVSVGIVSDQDTLTVATTPFLLPVRSVVPEDAEDIVDLMPIAEFPAPVWPWLLFLALLIAAMAAFLYWFRRSPEIISLGRSAPIERKPPLEEATLRLDELERANVETDASKKAFFVELSDILRTYIARRLGPPALESTSREVTEALRELGDVGDAPESMITPVSRVLETSDLAKFAEIFPSRDRCLSSIVGVRDILDQVETHLQPPAEPATEEAAVITENA